MLGEPNFKTRPHHLNPIHYYCTLVSTILSIGNLWVKIFPLPKCRVLKYKMDNFLTLGGISFFRLKYIIVHKHKECIKGFQLVAYLSCL